VSPASAPTIRAANQADAWNVEDCVHRAYEPWVRRLRMRPGPMLEDYANVIEMATVFVAEYADALAGVLVLRETDLGLLLENIAVMPEKQGQGVGKKLLLYAEQVARSRGHPSIYLYTHELMSENIDLYARIGYVEFERREEHGFRRVYMRKAV
jgi:GNAT superfamily N-acetyltransferase